MFSVEVRDRIMIGHSLPDPFFGPAQAMHGATFVVDVAFFRESLTRLQRTVRANRSKMAQAETRFQTAKRRYEMELAKKDDLDRQLKACMMRATQPGLVAYGDLNASASSRYNESIEEGVSVRFRQTVLTIPNMSQMGVHVNIHESQVKKIHIGQPALHAQAHLALCAVQFPAGKPDREAQEASYG